MTAAPLAVALDLGGTRARGALVNAGGKVLERADVATAATAGPAVVVEQLADLVAAVSRNAARSVIRGVGVCSPGPLDTSTGVALDVPTLKGFVDLPLRRMLEERLGLPVRLENDAIAATLAEWRFGAGRGLANLVYITVSTGIGGGVVADGRILRGRRGMAGHVGHMTIVRDGMRCDCGNLGCWEAYGSGSAFTRRARTRAATDPASLLAAMARSLDGAAVFAAAAAGDALARELVAEEADILGVGIGALLHLYSPDAVVVGGGMSANFAALQPGILARLRRAAMPGFRDVPVVPSSLADNSGLVGVATLVLDGQE